jgi:hypothetical protein
MQLDEYKEKYKAIARATNAQSQRKKLQILEYNFERANDLHRNVSTHRIVPLNLPSVNFTDYV